MVLINFAGPAMPVYTWVNPEEIIRGWKRKPLWLWFFIYINHSDFVSIHNYYNLLYMNSFVLSSVCKVADYVFFVWLNKCKVSEKLIALLIIHWEHRRIFDF